MTRSILRNFSLAVTLAVGTALSPGASAASPARTQLAPNASFTVGGQPRSIAAYRGNKALLWLFSTWCPSCQVGLAALAKEQSRLVRSGLRVIVLENYKNGGYPGPAMSDLISRQAKAVLHAPNWTFGHATAELAAAYNPRSYPDVYYFIRADGTLAGYGSAPSATMAQILEFAGAKP